MSEIIRTIKEFEDGTKLVLEQTDKGLSLTKDGQSLIGDFKELERRIKPNNLNGELVVKAAKFKNMPVHPVLIDATAGLGADSFLLAAYGFNVHLYERNPVIAELLADTIKRAKEDPELSEIASRMTLHKEDSIEAMKQLAIKPDVILLDPMFPERTKSALVKKKFQLIHYLENPCTDETELLSAAFSASPQKIIVKRPIKAPFLAGRKPSYDVKDKIIRYDCYI